MSLWNNIYSTLNKYYFHHLFIIYLFFPSIKLQKMTFVAIKCASNYLVLLLSNLAMGCVLIVTMQLKQNVTYFPPHIGWSWLIFSGQSKVLGCKIAPNAVNVKRSEVPQALCPIIACRMRCCNLLLQFHIYKK